MGEYLENIKIGTCENLYYTTFAQLSKSTLKGKDEYLALDSGFRFRFPFPNEKNTRIGNYDDFNRGYLIKIPVGIFSMDHGNVFIRTDTLPNINAPAIGMDVPCAMSGANKVYRWENVNFYFLEVVQQKYVTDHESGNVELQTVFRCPYCKRLARANFKEAQSIANEIIKQSCDIEKEDETKANELKEIALTIISGYFIRFGLTIN